jgi:hypothetical protein
MSNITFYERARKREREEKRTEEKKFPDDFTKNNYP